MGDREIAESLKPIKEAVTNATRGSVVNVEAERGPMLFFRPETGELIAVPPADATALNAEIGHWNSLIATLHDANEQVQYYEDVLSKLTLKPNLGTPGAVEAAEKNVAAAVERQEKALDAAQEELKSLAKIETSGKELVELIPLPTESRRRSENKPGELEDGKFKQSWFQHSIGDGTKRTFSKDKIRRPAGSFVYVPSDKLKNRWPRFKDPAEIKWSDTLGRRPNGSISNIDADKARQYGQQLKKKLKLQSDFFSDCEVDFEGVLGEWATAWSKQHKFNKEYTPGTGPVDYSIELDAGAQLMRYLCGGSLHATFEPYKKNVAFRAEGHAEIALAEAKGTASLYFPGKDGWMWTLPPLLHRKGVHAKDVDLGATRFAVAVEFKGVVGASIAGEFSLGVETKEGQMPRVRGKKTRRKGQRRARNTPVVELGPEKTMRVAGADVELDVFAGLKAEAEIKGAYEWRNPEDPKKEFEAFASLAPTVGGLAGIGGTAKLSLQYTDGVFKLHTEAALCIGLGAEGKLSFEVSIKLFVTFAKWFFYQVYHSNFRMLPFIEEAAYDAMKQIRFLTIVGGKDLVSTFGMSVDELDGQVQIISATLDKPGARTKLAQRILLDADQMRYALPETKGMLIYQLSQKDNIGNHDIISGDQRMAIRHILERWSHTVSDYENVVQHISPDGKKGSYDVNLVSLRTIFDNGASANAELAERKRATFNEFDEWQSDLLARLKAEPTRGYPVVPTDSFEYAMQRDSERDHPLFASTGETAYYA